MYQWQSSGDGNNWINLTTGSSLLLGDAEVGRQIRIIATYVDLQGTFERVISAASSSVININDLPSGSVGVSGAPLQGQTITAVVAALADADGLGSLNYVWRASGNVIAGAIGNSLILTEAQVGKTVTVTVSYIDGYGTAESVTSNTSSLILNVNDAPVGGVSLVGAGGTPLQGQTISVNSADLSDADGLGTLSYQWKANNVVIANALASSFAPTQTEVGKTISVVVTYSDGHGTIEQVSSAASNAIGNVNDNPTGVVSFSGGAVQGHTLLASNNLADADGIPASGSGAIAYQWQISLDGNTAWSNLGGAAAITDSYPLSSAEVGRYVRVVATYVDLFAHAESVASAAGLVSGPPMSRTVDVLAYTWNTHTLLDAVQITQGNLATTTDTGGHSSLSAIFESNIALVSMRPIPSAEISLNNQAVDLSDAIAILRLVVGLEVNVAGHALSPYQALAADFNADGVVDLADAIGVLAHVVGLSAPAPQWLLINESDASIPGRANLHPGSISDTTNVAFLEGAATVHVGLVGVLRGDVDGSYGGLPGAADLDATQPTYIGDLIARLGLQASQFGVYGV